MGRAPCCDKVGLKKGPWTIEEDRILINFIQRHGHGNWRALPKQAGLLRCGKSCRLRWMNYLKPDIKRGNFTKEEEDTIIQLHETMGNKWSAIAARLPGRTDNEIKNIWHTYLKKRLPKYQLASTKTKRQRQQKVTSSTSESPVTEILMQSSANLANSSPAIVNDTSTTTMISQNVSDSSISNNITPNSPQQSSSDGTSSVTYQTNEIDNSIQSYDSFPMIDETFWSQDLLNNELDTANTPLSFGDDWTFQFPKDNIATDPGVPLYSDNNNYNSNNIITNTSTEFWYDIFVKAGESAELLEF